MTVLRKCCKPFVLLALATSLGAAAQQGRTAPTGAEARAARALDAAKKQGSPELYAFLKPFPKGADLHMHLSGAVYAETFLAEAAEQGLCVDPVALSFDRATPDLKPGACVPGHLPAADAIRNETLYDKLIDSFSMRGFVPSEGVTGHDQFFATFDRFGGLKSAYTGAWLDEVATRAAAQNEQYLEIMQTPSFGKAITLSRQLGWPAELNDSNYKQLLPRLHDAMLAGGLRDDVAADTKEFADAQTARRGLEFCDGDSSAPQALSAGPTAFSVHPARNSCSVQIHFLYQVLRGFAPEQVFAQTLLAFEVASADPDVVGINFVRAEDWRGPMQNYHVEQLMLDYLHSVYPKVHISLHAGELAIGMVPPDGLTFHIHEAVDLGHAERIGHGVDVLYETHPEALLQQMARQHTMVEINLTSNDVILGIRGDDHSLAAYRAAHVPWALSTDDEGVSRIDLTHEYVRAVRDQNLTYADLKQSARTSLEHAFLPGPSLWVAPDSFTRRTLACSGAITPTSKASPACTAFLQTSERAAQQWELERRLAAFEANVQEHPAGPAPATLVH